VLLLLLLYRGLCSPAILWGCSRGFFASGGCFLASAFSAAPFPARCCNPNSLSSSLGARWACLASSWPLGPTVSPRGRIGIGLDLHPRLPSAPQLVRWVAFWAVPSSLWILQCDALRSACGQTMGASPSRSRLDAAWSQRDAHCL